MSHPKKNSRLKIILTGGGTAGHVLPALAVAAELRQLAPTAQLFYIGSEMGPEHTLAEAAGYPFFAIATGKLRRYFTWENVRDAVRVPLGIWQAWRLLKQLQPKVIFSKGGFVAVPVVIAAGLLRIPVIAHESDASPGLATRLSARFAKTVAISFAATAAHFPAGQTVLTGNPTRPPGSATRGQKFLKFQTKKPLVFVTGGSLGAQFLNELMAQSLPSLARVANVVWLTGADKRLPGSMPANVRVLEYLGTEYLDVLAAADLVVCRAGAGTLAELAAAGKPAILVPLPTGSSRGDQLENAQFFATAGAAQVAEQAAIQPTEFAKMVEKLLKDAKALAKMGRAASALATPNAARKLAELLLATAIK